ncbi:Copper resistance protein D [Salmonella enterica subsp. enterica serovar Senftenberg str. A4-543]|uniref:Copper resistance protein D n=1 Tax=Salmonella enterica subsp. enterica serovar Senftenberg str. A4-543 TaxID=913082 RepID=G5QZK2_SALSE|nr:Copper resistance protein D [Salmonella enterica subsp. enterica serovar Senftenberg str. A4-543]
MSCLLMTMSGGVALATLAWGGHAVMHDGLHYYLHLLSDLTHLGAAGAWTGALVAFAILLMRRNEHNAQSVIVISDSLAKFATKFATAGTVIPKICHGRNGDCCSPDPECAGQLSVYC